MNFLAVALMGIRQAKPAGNKRTGIDTPAVTENLFIMHSAYKN